MTDHLTEVLIALKEHGSSVSLNYGEDTGAWELSWVTGGVRYTGVGRNLGTVIASLFSNLHPDAREFVNSRLTAYRLREYCANVSK